MNAFELADELTKMLQGEEYDRFVHEIPDVLRQQADRIAELEKLVSEMKYEKSSGVYEKQTPLTEEQIHNIYLFIEGKVAGMAEHKIKADFPVMLVRAIEQMHGIK